MPKAPFLLAVLVLGLPQPAGAGAGAARETLLVEDLAATGARAAHAEIPIVLLMSASWCGYCDVVREEFLVPMLISGDYRDRAILRELPIDGPPVTDFDGEGRLPEKIAERYRVTVVPTLLFLDGAGRELTERMVGVGLVDFFGAYLETALERAEGRLEAPREAP